MPAQTVAQPGAATLLSVKSNLMEDYRLATPELVTSEYAAIFSTPDDPEVFVIVQGAVCDIYPDSTSDSGYSVLSIPVPGTPESVAAAIAANGTITLFVSMVDGSLWSASYSSHSAAPTLQSVALPPNCDRVYALQAVTTAAGPSLMASAGSSVPVMGPNIGLYLYSAGQWSGGPVQLYAKGRRAWRPVTLASGAAGALLLTESVLYPYYSVCLGQFSSGAVNLTTVAQGGYIAVAAAPGANGPALFALQPPLPDVPGPGGIVWLTAQPEITSSVIVQAFAASADSSGICELIAIGCTGELYHTRQDAAGSSSWSQFVPIAGQPGQTFVAVQALQDPSGDMRVLAVTSENDLYQIWQDPDTSDWYFEEIEYSIPGSIQPFNSYRTQITFYDNNSVPAAGADVQIFTDQPVTLAINGVTTGLSASAPWSGAADGSGCLILSYLTGSISVGALSVWSSFMDAGDCVALDPSGPAQSTLASLTPDGAALLQQRVYDSNGNSQPLFTGTQAEAASISQAVLQAMTLAGVSASPVAQAKYLHRNNDPRAARVFSVAGGVQPGQIDLAAVPAQNWEVNFTSSGPQFQNLSSEVAAANRAARASLPTIQGILGFDCDWGDVMNMLVDGAVEIVQFAVDKLSDGIHAAITFTIDTVTAVFDTIIQWVRQAIDLVEQIFQFVGAGFEQLFGWLGYLFNWTDILFVKNGIKSLLTQSFTVISDLIMYLQSFISAWLNEFNTQIDGFFKTLIQGLGVDTVETVQAAEPAAPVDAESLNSKNIVLSGFINNADQAPSLESAAGLKAGLLGDPLDTLMQAIQQAAASYQEGGANYNNFMTALGYFETMGNLLLTQPDQALLNGIAGFLQTLNAIAQAAVSTINTLITVILAALAEVVQALGVVLATPWKIPYVYDLYKYVAHAELSALDLGALIVAIPVTIAYKLVSSDPLPDLTQFTAAQIEAMLGVQPQQTVTAAQAFRKSLVADTWDPPPPETLKLVWLGNYLATGGYAWVNYKVDTTPVALPGPPSLGDQALSLVNIITEMAVYVMGAPCWSMTAPTTMAVVEWALGGIGLAIDMGTFKVGMQIQELNGDVGVILTTIIGAVYLVGAIVYWAVDGDGLLDMPHVAGLVATMPEWMKILRLNAISKQPWGLAALKALGVVDVVCNILPATFVLGFNWNTLPPSQAQIAPATA